MTKESKYFITIFVKAFDRNCKEIPIKRPHFLNGRGIKIPTHT